MIRVAVCIATLHRPEGLRRLLRALDGLVFLQSARPVIEVVVVDNDADGSGREVCRELAPGLGFRLRYLIEPRRGISFARNRAIDGAGEADFVAFLDDDEVPDPHWLDELLAVQRAFEAEIIAGPVIPYFFEGAPAWARHGGFWSPRPYATGEAVRDAGTCNVLIRGELLRRMRPAFDPRFALSGGEDTHFFWRANRARVPVLWARDARVVEWVPRSRLSAKWLLRRAYRVGTTVGFVERDLDPSLGVALNRLLRGLGRMALGAAGIVVAPLGGPRVIAGLLWGARWIVSGAGMIAGVAGRTYHEYGEQPT
jgi:glycosyltransferase involved in cell wall biosynthesis